MTAPTLPSYLGVEAVVLPILFYAGTTWVQTITPTSPGVFPNGTTVQIAITSPGGAALATWSASVAPTAATFQVPNAATDPIPANSRYLITVTYPTVPATTYPWFAGPILRPSY